MVQCKQKIGQMTVHLYFVKSDRNFRAVESLSYSTVAAARPGNDRFVRYSKLFGFICRGKYGIG